MKPHPEPEVILSGIARDLLPEAQRLVDEIGLEQVRANIRAGLERMAKRNPGVRAMVDQHYKEHPLRPTFFGLRMDVA